MKTKMYHLVWADWVRVVATYLVIVIHMSAGILIDWQHHTSFSWWAAHSYDSIARVAVPLFVMLSGCLLLSKAEPLSVFIFKRVRRVVFPWLWWVVVTVILDHFLFNELNVWTARPTHILSRYFLTGFWFMPLLLQLYFFVPLLRAGVQKIPPTVGFLVTFLVQLAVSGQSTSCLVQASCDPWLLPLGLQYLGYFVLGYYLREVTLSTTRKWFLVSIWLLSITTILYGTYVISLHRGNFSEVLYQYTALPVLLASISSFSLLKYFFSSNILASQSKTTLLSQLSKASFGIFLVHAIIVKVLAATPLNIVFTTLSNWAVIGIPLLALLLFFVSYAVIYGMKKVKYLQIFT